MSETDGRGGSIGQTRYLDVHAAATYLGVTDRFVRRLIEQRRVPFYKFGRLVRFTPADLDRFAAAGRVEAANTPQS